MLKKAPLAFVLLLVVGVISGARIEAWRDSGQMASLQEQIRQKDDKVSRYRVALGIDPASRGALVELNNEELYLKAESVVAKLRTFASKLDGTLAEIKKRVDSNKIDKKQAWQETMEAMKQVSQDLDKNLASEAYNVDNELRNRLDPKAISHVVRVPAIVSDEGVSIPITALSKGSGWDSFYIKALADEIEQMAKLLPTNGSTH